VGAVPSSAASLQGLAAGQGGLLGLLRLTLLAHEGEEFVIILPAIMLVGAFFIIRWANQSDKGEDDALEDNPEDGPVGLVLPTIESDENLRLD
jgi:hypothetical protein